MIDNLQIQDESGLNTISKIRPIEGNPFVADGLLRHIHGGS